jgi:hypothetical protein
MAEIEYPLHQSDVSRMVAEAVKAQLGGISASPYKLTPEQQEAIDKRTKEAEERKAYLKQIVMSEVIGNLAGVTSQRAANKLSQAAGAKAKLVMAAMKACDDYDAGDARIDNRFLRNFGGNAWSD